MELLIILAIALAVVPLYFVFREVYFELRYMMRL